MIPLPIVLLCITLFTLAGLLWGRNLAIHAHRAKSKFLEHAVTILEKQAVTFNEQLTRDPQRASIDVGKRYAANQMQTTIDRIREEIPK